MIVGGENWKDGKMEKWKGCSMKDAGCSVTGEE